MLGLNKQQVEESRQKYGVNKLPEAKQKTAWDFFMDTVSSDDGRLNRLLWLIVAIMLIRSFLTGMEGISDAISLGGILIVLSILAIKDGLKLQKAEKALKDKTGKRSVTVIRDGNPVVIDSTEIVVGDVVLIEAGSFIEADGYLIEGAIAVDNSVLNGENKECKKTPIPGYTFDREKPIDGKDYIDQNSVFSGTSVLTGTGKMVVTRVGTETENGKTLMLVGEVDETKTAIGIQINNIVDLVTKIGTISGITVGVILLIMNMFGIKWAEMAFNVTCIMVVVTMLVNVASNAISIVVAAVPEGLPAIIRIITSKMSNTMIRDNVLPKNTNRIPDAGCVDLIASDKTKTLTIGKLVPSDTVTADGVKMDSKALESLKLNIALNNDAVYDAEGKIINGNPTAQALLSILNKDEYSELIKLNSVADSKPFDSAWKYSAVTTSNGITLYKGAPEIILKHAKNMTTAGGKTISIVKDDVDIVLNKYADRAMRVLAFAHSNQPIGDELPEDLILDGFVTMEDALRPEVPDAVAACHNAGIQVMMVTGDNPRTAVAIAKDAGIYTEGNIALTADEFDAMSDEEAKAILPKLTVVGRATPRTKMRIVQIAQSEGRCVGMTGDGTNDAPALKAADIGFAMGCGTEVCKNASDIIITDNNFASVVKAILYGRTFMKNIGKFLKFQLPINFSLTVMSVLCPILLGVEAFTTTMILLFNVVMDTLNAISFGGEPAKPEYMQEKPRNKTDKLLSGSLAHQVIVTTIAMVVLNAILLIPGISSIFATSESQMSARFALTVFAAMLGSFNIRTDSRNLFKDILQSKALIKISLAVLVGTVILVQFAGAFIGCVAMSLTQWLVIIGLSLLIFPIDLIRKSIER